MANLKVDRPRKMLMLVGKLAKQTQFLVFIWHAFTLDHLAELGVAFQSVALPAGGF